MERHPATASGFENPRFYLREFAVQHLEFSQFPLDAPATVGRLLSLGERDAHAVTGRRISAFFRSLQRRTDFWKRPPTRRAIKRKTAAERTRYLGGRDGRPPVAQVLAPPVGPGDVLLELAVLLLHGADFLLQFAHNLQPIESQGSVFEQCLFHRRFRVKLR